MAAGDRSLSDVLQDIIRNVQEIVRSEVRLAKTEIREEAAKARSSMLLTPSRSSTPATVELALRSAVSDASAMRCFCAAARALRMRSRLRSFCRQAASSTF